MKPASFAIETIFIFQPIFPQLFSLWFNDFS